MIHVNYMAIIVGTVLAVAFSALYYFLLNKQVVAYRTAWRGKSSDVQTTISVNRFLVEFARCLSSSRTNGNTRIERL